ncbi:hypothetical protein [Varibaculum cambriense]|uniref:hypothetical protein n=2 Tax=Varibaculum TaxID=184869 RepID=UPI000C7A768A|nr:hypothetical protein [Varibaculum cambriense]MDU1224445.1 hypothetical protein [Varibaculum cambriense]WIK89235.1 hypothetical protein CYK25_003375 [Varibaculum cambriense]
MSKNSNISNAPEDLELAARKSDIDQLLNSWPTEGASIYPQVTLSDLETVANKLSAALDSLNAQVERK